MHLDEPHQEVAHRGAPDPARDLTGRLALLLDYDGTLVDLAPTPAAAAPDGDVLALLASVARCRDVAVHVVSGRPRDVLEAWLGHLPVGLHAEHGLWSRWSGNAAWQRRSEDRTSWLERLRPVMQAITADTDGSLLEQKTESFAWHYRQVAGDRASEGARRVHQAAAAAGPDVAVLGGHAVLEVRRRGIHKGLVVPEVVAGAPGARLVAVGDDATDEDMFAALPPGSLAIRVGDGPSRCTHRLPDPGALRALLRRLIAARAAAATTELGEPSARASDGDAVSET
jgi:trehalose 6-phosphate synthase/phosphatase